ncbi:hypothetical protein M513_09028, partial [Trichuris suis]
EHHDICEVPIVSSASVQRNKKKRKVTTLEAKLNVVALREDGRPVMDIARCWNRGVVSTVRGVECHLRLLLVMGGTMKSSTYVGE